MILTEMKTLILIKNLMEVIIMESLFSTTPELTKKITTCFYSGEPEYLFSYLDEDIVWIEPLEPSHIIGKKQLIDIFSKKYINCFDTINSNFNLISQKTDFCIVIGWIELSINKAFSCFLKYRQRVTFIYKLKNGRLTITYIHLNEYWNLLSNNNFFSFPFTEKSYDLIKQFIPVKKEKKDKKSLIIYDINHSIHFIQENNIIYVEANNTHSFIYCTNEKIIIVEGIGKFQKRLSSKFIRVHRSFLINVDYVISIKRFTIELYNKMLIPIPEKKYTYIKKLINQVKESL